MKKKTFIFRKIATGGKLIVEASSEKAARHYIRRDPEAWELLPDASRSPETTASNTDESTSPD